MQFKLRQIINSFSLWSVVFLFVILSFIIFFLVVVVVVAFFNHILFFLLQIFCFSYFFFKYMRHGDIINDTTGFIFSFSFSFYVTIQVLMYRWMDQFLCKKKKKRKKNTESVSSEISVWIDALHWPKMHEIKRYLSLDFIFQTDFREYDPKYSKYMSFSDFFRIENYFSLFFFIYKASTNWFDERIALDCMPYYNTSFI